MERVLKWSLPLLIVINVSLVISGVLDGWTALAIGVGIELLIVLVAARQLWVAARRFRSERDKGYDFELALEKSLSTFFPELVARLIVLEPRTWVYLWRWLFRRRSLAPNEFSHNGRSPFGPLLLVMLVSAPVELLLFELLIPWPVVKWTILILSIYSVIWLAGLVASMRVLPHSLEPDGLRVRYGILASAFIPYTTINSARLNRRTGATVKEGLQLQPGSGVTSIAVGTRTDLTIELSEPVTLRGLLHDTPPVTLIHLAADKPAALVDTLSIHLTAAPPLPAQSSQSPTAAFQPVA